MKEVWSIDPGEKIGFCQWTPEGKLLNKDTIDFDSLMSILLRGKVPEVIVYEKWAFQPGKTGGGDKMLSSQEIGMLKLYGAQYGVTLVEQDPSILRVTALHMGKKVPKGHIPDADSAELHGFYYFETRGVLQARTIWD